MKENLYNYSLWVEPNINIHEGLKNVLDTYKHMSLQHRKEHYLDIHTHRYPHLESHHCNNQKLNNLK